MTLCLSLCAGKVEFTEKDSADGDKKEIVVTMDRSAREKAQIAWQEVRKSTERNTLLYESALVSLVSSIEVFCARILHSHFAATGSIPGAKEKQFSFEELEEFSAPRIGNEL